MMISQILKTATGQFEITRTLGALGVLVFIVVAAGLECWEVFGLHKEFDLVAWCTAFPAGLGAAIAVIAYSAGAKDKATAAAAVTQATGVQKP